MVDDPREDEKQIGEPIDVSDDRGVGRWLERYDSPFGAAADRTSHVQRSPGRCAAGQNKAPQRWQLRFEPIDHRLEPRDVGVGDRSFRDAAGDRARRVGQARAEREQVALDLQERFVDVRIERPRTCEAQIRVHFVDFAICIDPSVGLADARPVEQRRLASIAGAGVDLHRVVPLELYEMTAKQTGPTTKRAKAARTSGAARPSAMPSPRDRRRFRERLLAWYRRHGRDLPWRKTNDPYHILVSEIMLQQTQVDRVLPKYTEWLEKYPSLGALASARESEVAATWYPLGYNIRPMRLQTIAREAVLRYGGQLPADEETLLSFKGIGAYTVGAIRSFAFGQRAAILDTNVARVLFRVFVAKGDRKSHATKRHLWTVSETLVPSRHVFDFNQALMDLGAMVCVARNPKCLVCPMARFCRACPFNPSRERGTSDQGRAGSARGTAS